MTPSRRTLVGLSAGAALTGVSARSRAAEPPRTGVTVSVRAFGAKGDGAADDTGALLAAARSGAALTIPAGRYPLTRDITFSAPITFAYRGVLDAAHGVTITFAAGLAAPIHQIFALAAGARVVIDARFATDGHPEWWGARTNAPDFDCQPAIQAALRASARTLLQAADYYIGSTLKITDHGRRFEGVASGQNGHVGCSRLMLTSGTADGLQVGYDRQPANPKLWLEHVRVSDITVQRVAAIANPSVGFSTAPCGVRLQWAVTCYLERVETIEHSHGFYITGTVHCYLKYCQSLRYTAGIVERNDFFNGFFMDNSPSTGFNSGNASLYIQNCSTFSTQAIAFTESNGVKSYMGYTDTFISGFECALVEFGLNMNGHGGDGIDYESEDLIVDTCVLDSPTGVGILLNTGSQTTAVQIQNCYVAPAGPGVAIEVRDSTGSVGVTGCQLIATPNNTATGLKITRSRGVSAMNNIHTDLQNPVVVQASSDCRVADTMNNVRQKTAVAAVHAVGLDRGYLAVIVRGAPNVHPVGIALQACVNVEVNCTGIRPSCLVGGSADTLVCDGVQVRAPGRIAGNNLVSGILG